MLGDGGGVARPLIAVVETGSLRIELDEFGTGTTSVPDWCAILDLNQ